MADSIRAQVMTAVLSALTGITTARGYQSSVVTVSENIRHWTACNPNEMPAIFPIDTGEDKDYASFGTSSRDMRSRLSVVITSYLYKLGGVTAGTRSDLLRDVEKAMVNSTAMTTVNNVLFIRPIRVTTDQGTIDNYSIHDQEFQIEFLYSHADGG